MTMNGDIPVEFQLTSRESNLLFCVEPFMDVYTHYTYMHTAKESYSIQLFIAKLFI